MATLATKTTTPSSVEQVICHYIAENLLYTDGELPVGYDDSFIDQGVVDSTGILSLQLFVEEAFGIEVEDDEVVPENFDSVNSLASYVRRKQQPGY